MKFVLFSLLVMLFLLEQKGWTQDTIYLLNGDIRTGDIIHVDSTSITYTYLKKSKVKSRVISNDLIFKMILKNGERKIIYGSSITPTSELSIANMELCLLGMQDAKATYSAPWITIGGIASQIVVGYFLYDNFAAGLGPLSYTAIVGLSKTDVSKNSTRPAEIVTNSYYQEGFRNVAGSKKIFNALAGSMAGLLIGITLGNVSN